MISKNLTISIGGALLAFAAGGVGGYFAAHKRLEKIHAERFDDAVSLYKRITAERYKKDLEDYYNSLLSDDTLITVEEAKQECKKNTSTKPETVAILNTRPDKYDTPEAAVADKADSKVQYDKISEKYRTQAPATVPPRSANGRFKAKGPFIIDEKDYVENPDDYAQVTLTYYTEDKIVAEDDEPYDDAEANIGIGNLNELDDDGYDSNVMLVRNDVIQTDFEIIKTNGSYSETVVGLSDE